ncbi:MAG TPA: cytochrome c [Gemmatimonadetes bacterium]|nr:cytochrome c [Gemmatimonadota bacterium]
MNRLRVNARASRPVFFSVALVLSADAGTVLPAVAQDVDALSQDELQRGRSHYMASCGRCHGVNGGGGEGPPLATARLPRAPDDASLIRIMNQGITGTAMPRSRWLSEEDLRLVAGYVRSLAPSGAADAEPVAGDPGRGRELYESGRCAGCHTVGGFGTGRGPDLTTVGSRRGTSHLRESRDGSTNRWRAHTLKFRPSVFKSRSSE